MLAVRTAPVVEPDTDDGWRLTFWLGEPFDFSTPFRASLDEIARLLGEQPQQALALPPYDEGEDFVEGALRFGRQEVRTYYEYCLGYLSLSHHAREPLDFIATRVQASMRLK